MRCAALLLLLAAIPARADTLDDLKKAQEAADKAYSTAMRALPESPAGQKDADRLWEAYDREQAARFDAAVRQAIADPKSDRACDALNWVLSTPRAFYLEAGIPAFDLATTFHAANPKIGRAAAIVSRFVPWEQSHPRESAAALRLIEAVAAKNPDRTTRGQAKLGLAYQLYGRFAVAEYKRSKDTERLAAETEAAYEAIVRDYSDCPDLRSKSRTRTLGDTTNGVLHELRNLRVGKVAPDIVGDDLDGKRLKLFDSRGKITLLVFWGSWCGPCMRQVPHERKLVEQLAGKPFVLVGVNSDDDRAKAREVATREKMTWRSFWNGTDGAFGSISQAWNVSHWPESYLLDAAGVVRYRGVFGDDLDAAVAELLAELEKK